MWVFGVLTNFQYKYMAEKALKKGLKVVELEIRQAMDIHLCHTEHILKSSGFPCNIVARYTWEAY